MITRLIGTEVLSCLEINENSAGLRRTGYMDDNNDCSLKATAKIEECVIWSRCGKE